MFRGKGTSNKVNNRKERAAPMHVDKRGTDPKRKEPSWCRKGK
jgi:hypothetical protein